MSVSKSRKSFGGKNYTAAERKKYHEDRLQSPSVSKNQKAYSRHWLDGFNDSYADTNLQATANELKKRKQYVAAREKDIARQKQEVKEMKAINKTVYGGFINGAKAKLKLK